MATDEKKLSEIIGYFDKMIEAISRLEESHKAILEKLNQAKSSREQSSEQIPQALDLRSSSDEPKSQFQQIAEALMSKGNKPRTTRWIIKTTGIPRSSLSQILHRTHKDSFVSHSIPGYTRKKLWSLTDDAARLTSQLSAQFARPTLFGTEGDLTDMTAVDCCARILRDHANEPMNALTMAREAISRGYHGKARGSEDEVLLTTAKSFWAALGRDQRFEQVRPLVFRLREVGSGSPP